jgi:hypothetical protein
MGVLHNNPDRPQSELEAREANVGRQTTEGTCTFCGRTFSKGGITRHLMACDARRQAYAALSGKRGLRTTRLLHLRVEGREAPEYWMNVELPADATLYDLDDFLRETWLECCGHLSAFDIEGREYLSEREDDDWMRSPPLVAPPVLGALPLIEEPTYTQAKEAALEMARLLHASREAQAAFLADLDRIAGPDPGARLTREQSKQVLVSMARMLGMGGLETTDFLSGSDMDAVYDEFEDEFGESGMDVVLGEVLRPGMTFHHEYDFGSTTELVLHVIEEREGLAVDEESTDIDSDVENLDYVTVLARNEPPKILCSDCGQNPAALVCTNCIYSGTGWLCNDCAPKHDCGEEVMLPVVNSPRVGVCGYTGDVDIWDMDPDADLDDFDPDLNVPLL